MVAYRPIQQASHDLAVLANQFKQAGRGDLRRMLLARIRTAGEPTVKAVQARARATLPRRGGFAELVAANVGVRSSLASSGASVRIRRNKRTPTDRTLVGIDSTGSWRHPVYGDRDTWVEQTASGAAGYFTRTIDGRAPAFRSAVLQAMDDVTARLRKGI